MLATDAVNEIADTVWDELLTGSSHNIATSAGRRLRQIDVAFVITEGTAQAGTANTITLAAGESALFREAFGVRRILAAVAVALGVVLLNTNLIRSF